MDGTDEGEGASARLADASGLRVWRLSDPGRAPGHDDREACLSGGRWNSEGVPALYCSASLPLAVLESWVHIPEAKRRAPLPEPVAVCLELPEGALALDLDGVEPGDDEAARRAGDAWARGRRALALRVPSAVVPQACNVVLNPDHPDYARLRVVAVEPCPYDPRLAVGTDEG